MWTTGAETVLTDRIAHMFDTSLQGPPGPALAAALPVVPPADMDDEQLIDAIAGWERLAGWAAAGQLAALAEFARRRPRDLLDQPPGHADTGHPGAPEVSESPSTNSPPRCTWAAAAPGTGSWWRSS